MSTVEEKYAIRQARIKEIKDANLIPTVFVLPRDESIRKYIAHMPTRIKFPAAGPAKWPLDTFTRRRIADGDVTIVEEESEPEQQAAPTVATPVASDYRNAEKD